MSTYDPERWLTTMQRALKNYVETEIDACIDGNGNGGGSEIFNVVFDYPVSSAGAINIDLDKTIIQMDIDDIENIRLGFGPNIIDDVYTPGDVSNPATLVEREAYCHRVNYNVGVWASDVSGGITSRLLAYEILSKIFVGEQAKEKCMQVTQGVEIRDFQSGQFIVDTINDIRIFRIIESELIVRVYSRKDGNELIVPDTLTQDPHLTIPPLAIT